MLLWCLVDLLSILHALRLHSASLFLTIEGFHVSLYVLVLAIVALLLFGLWRVATGRAAALATEAQKRQIEAARLRAQVASLERELETLRPWRVVADADARAHELLRTAEAAANQLREEADRVRASAAEEATAVRAQAIGDARAARQVAQAKADTLEAEGARIVEASRLQADAIVADARTKAEEVAGRALAALEQRDELIRTIEALKNITEGYGDRYIVPTHALLDDLAEGFAHTDAGRQLKLLRQRIREVVSLGRAADCEYVEPNRRTTAIRFVTDAFNGKADSILSRARTDNAGTLQQELRDAFQLVNFNGAAFRNARIRDEYLAMRLEELHLASVIDAIKDQERDEQRRIREQMREEEKARRDFERALKDAEKEEGMLKKAMERAEAQLAKATAEQREKYEVQLAELSQKLQEAEARGQRALSMAQQTRRGHVYVISNVGSLGEHVYKIGLTRRLDPLERVRELGDSSVPFEFDVHALIFAEDAPALESQLHRHFVLGQVNKVNHRKEFFRAELAHIRSEIETLGLEAQWTMTAAAREFRETQAIERTIAGSDDAREAWVKRQLLLEPVGLPFEDSPGSDSPNAIAEAEVP